MSSVLFSMAILLVSAQTATTAQCHGRPQWQEPVRARTEVTQRAQALDPELDRQLQAGRQLAWAAKRAGRQTEAALRYEQNWKLLPPTLGRWDNSIVVATDALRFHFDEGRWEEALRWVHRLKIAHQGGQNSGVLIWLGKIRYEQGLLDTSRACFALAHLHWGDRIFGRSPKDGKYFAFFHELP